MGEIWFRALTRPSESTFDEITRDPNLSARRAYGWIILSSLVGFILYVMIGSLTGATSSLNQEVGSTILFLLCGAPFAVTSALVGIIFTAGVSQLIAGALGGEGSYTKLVYALSAYVAPLGLITSLLSAIPFALLLAYPLGLYGIFLNILAIKAVNKFGWGRAAISSIAILILLFALVAIVVIVILALLGPAIGEVFSEIQQGINTPAP